MRHELDRDFGTDSLDWLLIFSRRHLERVLRIYIHHYNCHRPHRALRLQAPELEELDGVPFSVESTVRRRDRLGGLFHEYYASSCSELPMSQNIGGHSPTNRALRSALPRSS